MGQISLSIQRKGQRITWAAGPLAVRAFGWETADEICRGLRVQFQRAEAWTAGVPADGQDAETTVRWDGVALQLRHEAGKVLVISGGKLLFDMPPAYARKLWTATVAQARLAEEEAKADALVMDQAIVMRAGAPFGLTDNPKIQAEAVKEAVHNRNLRRFMPGGVRATRILGAPVVRMPKAKPAAELRALMRRMSPADRSAFQARLAGAAGTVTT
jgi:hypothetical protein